ncbi:PilZ domain-containing protein [Ramlibacter sp. AN1015]|uniref:PilZ domain-containing protein n=1 Tax=Ramlibacter sp. AN1015 TaxID=3133428 RepID=UPI0030BC1B67
MPGTTPQDQRSDPRFGLALPITMGDSEGRTHDLSARGVLFEVQRPPALGSRVALRLLYAAGGTHCQLPCQGRVVRIDALEGGYNVAVQFDRPLFR